MSKTVSLSSETVAAIAMGDRTAISRLLAEALPGLQLFDESGLLIEPITSGYSGASIFKVFQRDSNNPALLLRVPGDKSPDSVTQIFF